jgi:amino acid transporter
LASGVVEGASSALSEPGQARAVRTSLRWFDGVVLALTMPAALIATLGYSIQSLGAWDAIALWGASMLIATLANWIYAELAAMFPDKAGGIALYAWEGWRRHFTPVGPLATFGYWFAWSSSIAVFATIIGNLVQAEWFPGQTWVWHLVDIDVTFPRVVAGGVIVGIWVANIMGLRLTMWLAYVTAALLLVPLVVFMVVPFLTGDWSGSTLTAKLGDAGQDWGGARLALVWLYIMCWTSLGVETCATFTPEYSDGARAAGRALRVAALFSLTVFVLLPLGAAGTAGEADVARSPLTFYVPAFAHLVGSGGSIMVGLIVASLVLVVNTCFADSSRALFGVAKEGMTIRGLDQLNRFGVPARALVVDLLVNLFLVFFVGNTLAIVAAGNLGYVAAHVFALTGFLLLRRDRPDWPRPVRVGSAFVLIAVALAALLSVLVAVGATSFDLTGYGGSKELVIALSILGGSLLLFAFRRVAQDRTRLRLRERPDEIAA